MPSLEVMLAIAKRMHIGTVAWAALIIAAGTVELAFGFFPKLHPGFVRNDIFQMAQQTISSQTNSIVAGLRRHQALDDAAKILDLKEKECALPKDAPRDVYSRDILNLDQDYQEIVGRPYDIPGCDAL
jgi:hypothetical protein